MTIPCVLYVCLRFLLSFTVSRIIGGYDLRELFVSSAEQPPAPPPLLPLPLALWLKKLMHDVGDIEGDGLHQQLCRMVVPKGSAPGSLPPRHVYIHDWHGASLLVNTGEACIHVLVHPFLLHCVLISPL